MPQVISRISAATLNTLLRVTALGSRDVVEKVLMTIISEKNAIKLQSRSGGTILNFKRLTFLRGWNYSREGALQKLKFSYLWRALKSL